MEYLRCPSCQDGLTTVNTAWRCKSCKTNYKLENGIYRFLEDNHTEIWDHYWERTPVYDDIMDILRKIMNVQLRGYLQKSLPANALTLEPGGGSAYVSAMLAEKGFKAHALDYASAPLILAQKQLQSQAILIQGNMFRMPFGEDVFDLTFNNSTLEHLPNPLDALKEMTRVTKKSGQVFVGVPFTYGPLAIYKLKKSSFKGAWDGTTYDRQQLKRMFVEAGLEVVDSRTFFGRCFIGVLGKKSNH